jgi:hypothetical protein
MGIDNDYELEEVLLSTTNKYKYNLFSFKCPIGWGINGIMCDVGLPLVSPIDLL